MAATQEAAALQVQQLARDLLEHLYIDDRVRKDAQPAVLGGDEGMVRLAAERQGADLTAGAGGANLVSMQ